MDTQKRLRELHDKYWQDLDVLAEVIRERFVLPYCKKREYTFRAGMGKWSFYDKNGYPTDNISGEMYHILSAGMVNCYDIGSIVNDVTKEDLDSTP